MADERQAYTSRTWQTGDVITKQALNNIEDEMSYVSAEINNAVTGTINDQKLNDTLARKLDSVVKYFPNTPDPATDLEYVRMYAQPSTEGTITVPTEEEYLRFKQNFVQPFTNKAYVAGNYVEYEDEIYKVTAAIAKNNSAADDAAAWAAILALDPSPIRKINVMQEVDNLINVYTSDGQLTNEQNRIWIQQNGESVEVPTYEEFTSLSGSVDDLKSAYMQNDSYNTGTQMIVFERGVQITTPAVNETINISAKVTNPAAKCAVVPCTYGQKFTINIYGGSGARGWCITDANYKVLKLAESGLNTRNRIIVIDEPAAAWFILNNINNAVVDLPCYSGTLITDRVTANTTEIEKINDAGNVTIYDRFKRGIATGSIAPLESTAYKYLILEKSVVTDLYAYFTANYHVFYKISLFQQNETRLWTNDNWTEISNGTKLDLSKLDDPTVSTTYYIGVTVLYSESTSPTPIVTIPLGDMYLANNDSPSALLLHDLKINGLIYDAVVDISGKHGFTTINDAVNGTNDGDTILIMPGTYNESVKLVGKDRTLIGVDKERCIIYSGSGLRANPAMEANIGTIRNLTFISGNDNNISEDDQVDKAYGVHIDYPYTTPYKIVFDNCDFISYLNAGVGIGCRYNQTIIFNNCYFETKASKIYSGTYYTFVDIGGLLLHNDSINSSATGRGVLILNNCEIKGVTKAIMAQSVSNNKDMIVRFNKCLAYIANNGVSNVVGYWGDSQSQSKGTSPYFVGDKVILDSLSYGNNSPEIDFVNYWN